MSNDDAIRAVKLISATIADALSRAGRVNAAPAGSKVCTEAEARNRLKKNGEQRRLLSNNKNIEIQKRMGNVIYSSRCETFAENRRRYDGLQRH